MKKHIILLLIFSFILQFNISKAQQKSNKGLLTIDRIYNSNEFSQDYERAIQWIEDGNAYITIERSTEEGVDELIKYNTTNQERTVFVPANALRQVNSHFSIASFTLSPDGSKVLLFNNTSRVWRSYSKGDYWVYDLNSKKLKQVGATFAPSSLMFAKFSPGNKHVAFVHQFNIYIEDFESGISTQLTFDGNSKIINGTFDWAYEEEFGKRDGFLWSPDSKQIAFWQIDASKIGTYYMVNNTDSIYPKLIPLQYPTAGQAPSTAKIGIINIDSKTISWAPIDGTSHYIPGMQWHTTTNLLIQQMNRKQNTLDVWQYNTSNNDLVNVYKEEESTWVDLSYPDVSANGWGNNDLPLVENNSSFLRMTEQDKWRHIYKINIASGKKKIITPFNYDVASMRTNTNKQVFYIASPTNSTQRYLYSTDLKGKGNDKRITPTAYEGINNYNIAPNSKFAIHTNQSAQKVRTVRLISLPDHKIIKTLVDNKSYETALQALELPAIIFEKIITSEGVEVDARIILPLGFDESKKYPVLFHVYGEPWGQVATDNQVGLWNIMMAQKGYVIIDMDNRGTPCLKGSEWRKSIYRKVGTLNTKDQALAAKEILKRPYLDENRTAVWGWSGGGSMTLNLLFQYPEIYQTGIAVASVSDQLMYDNIYQERYMGLPQENKEDFIKGSPVTYAKNLKGNLLIIHGTGDDNVHYQSAELLINELIKHNKQFQMMSYPNRSHGIYEGENTSRHLRTLLTNYILTNTPPNK